MDDIDRGLTFGIRLDTQAFLKPTAVVARETVKQAGETIREKIRQNDQQPPAGKKGKGTAREKK